jgi:hypothetical protein
MQHQQRELSAGIFRLAVIRAERAALAARRQEVWAELGRGFDGRLARIADDISTRLVDLEDEARVLRARVRHGSRAEILGRARLELSVARSRGDALA